MEQKRVSFKVAKALKEVGYPQGWECDEHYCLESEGEYGYQIGDLVSVNTIHKNCLEAISAPTYLEAWLWLWKEKNIQIQNEFDSAYIWPMGISINDYEDPEEAIIASIDYLVDNKLLK